VLLSHGAPSLPLNPTFFLPQHVFVTAVQATGCGSRTLAYASTCQRDQEDRPVFAAINYCPNFLPASAAVGSNSFDFLLSVSLHETFHGEPTDLGYELV
jgi:hypothetical protein